MTEQEKKLRYYSLRWICIEHLDLTAMKTLAQIILNFKSVILKTQSQSSSNFDSTRNKILFPTEAFHLPTSHVPIKL